MSESVSARLPLSKPDVASPSCASLRLRRDGRSSVRLCHADGSDAGWIALRGEKFDRVRHGSLLKVEAFGLTAKGLLREARIDKDSPDSWLVRH